MAQSEAERRPAVRPGLRRGLRSGLARRVSRLCWFPAQTRAGTFLLRSVGPAVPALNWNCCSSWKRSCFAGAPTPHKRTLVRGNPEAGGSLRSLHASQPGVKVPRLVGPRDCPVAPTRQLRFIVILPGGSHHSMTRAAIRGQTVAVLGHGRRLRSHVNFPIVFAALEVCS